MAWATRPTLDARDRRLTGVLDGRSLGGSESCVNLVLSKALETKRKVGDQVVNILQSDVQTDQLSVFFRFLEAPQAPSMTGSARLSKPPQL